MARDLDLGAGWESLGTRDSKQVVASQLVHNAIVTYALDGPVASSLSLEVSNLTDARVFDFFGVQKPGRAFSLKATVTY